MKYVLPFAAGMVAVIAAGPALAKGKPVEAVGRCQYPEKARDYAAETTFIACDGARVEAERQDWVISFLRKGWDQSDRFYGQLDGSDIRIARVALRKAEPREAVGTCRVTHRADGRVSVASCLVKSRTRWIAANFVASGF